MAKNVLRILVAVTIGSWLSTSSVAIAQPATPTIEEAPAGAAMAAPADAEASPWAPSGAMDVAPSVAALPSGAFSPGQLTLSGTTVAKVDVAQVGAPKDAGSKKNRPPARGNESLLPPPPIEWNPKWAKFRVGEYFAIGIQGVLALAAQGIPGKARVNLSNGFDDKARKVFRARTLSGQREARDTSDALLVILVNQRLIDDLFVTWWGYGKGSVAYQLSLIDAETLTFSAAVQGLVSGITGRQRPYGESACARPLEGRTANCTGNNRYRAFFSGHTSLSFTLAGLTCIHHAYFPLYGGGFADGAACAGTMAAATTVAFMRVVADQHSMTDVIVGGAFGTSAGLLMPWLLHYRGGGKPEVKSDAHPKALSINATVMPAPNGLAVMGSF